MSEHGGGDFLEATRRAVTRLDETPPADVTPLQGLVRKVVEEMPDVKEEVEVEVREAAEGVASRLARRLGLWGR